MERNTPSEATVTKAPVTEQPRASRVTVIGAVLGALLLVSAGIYIAVLHDELGTLKAESTRTIEAHVKTIFLQAQQVEALDRLAARIDTFNRDFGASLGRLQLNENLEGDVKALAQKTHLPDDAKKTLAEFEQSVAAINEMTAKLKEYERYLGSPSTVKSGDNHSDLARAYLTKEAGLTAEEAERVMKRTALAWELQPGNQVFNLYHEGMLLSTVTQGTAKRSPLMVQWASRRAAAAKLQELEAKVQELEAKLAGTPSAAPEGVQAPAEAGAAAPVEPTTAEAPAD